MSDNDDSRSEHYDGEIENGHISLSDSNITDVDSSDEETPAQTSSTDQFDRDLPTTHRYLGRLNNVSGYTLYDDGEIVPILAIYTSTLVFPGFTLPLIMNNEENNVMQRFIEKNNVFVLICANKRSDGIFNYGVTMEIFETQMRNNVLNIKARGRQRCKIVPGCEIRTLAGRLQQVTVKMLAEPSFFSPLCDTQMLSLKAKRLFVSSNYSDLEKNYKYRRYHLSQYPFASWVYDKYEVSYCVKKIMERLTNYVGEYIPQDPVSLSYWVVQNFQLRHEERLKILELNSALERLKLELALLKLNRVICCLHCGEELTDPSKIISMSKDGTQSNYVNPGGHVYETVTVSFAKNFELIGNPSRQFSWFPGYAWTIMQCKTCNSHLGWRFTSQNLKPNCFYGLAKSGFNILINPSSTSISELQIKDLFNSNRSSYTEGFLLERIE